MNTHEPILAIADRFLMDAALNSFYGDLTFSFKAGKIVLVRRNETLIPVTVNGTTDAVPVSERCNTSLGESNAHDRIGTTNPR